MNYLWSWFYDEYKIPELQRPTSGYCLIDGKRGTGKTTLALHLLEGLDAIHVEKTSDWESVDIDTVKAVYVKESGVIDRSWGYFKLRELINKCRQGGVLVVIETQTMVTLPADLRQADYLFDTDNGIVLSRGVTYIYPFMTTFLDARIAR